MCGNLARLAVSLFCFYFMYFLSIGLTSLVSPTLIPYLAKRPTAYPNRHAGIFILLKAMLYLSHITSFGDVMFFRSTTCFTFRLSAG